MGGCCGKADKQVGSLPGTGYNNYDMNMRNRPPMPEPEPEPEPRPEQEPPTGEHGLVVAMADFNARGPNELSFKKGDILEVLDRKHVEWWLAKHPGKERIAHIPVPYIASSSSLESQDWYFGDILRVKAEEMLMSNDNSIGAFLLRVNQKGSGYAISCRMMHKGVDRVKHFLINCTDGGYFFLSTNYQFYTLNDLVDYCQRNQGRDLGVNMVYPCRRPGVNIGFSPMDDHLEADPSKIESIKKIGQGSFGEVWLGKFNNVDVAIKTLREDRMTPDEFLAEAEIMKGLHHVNILALYAICSRSEPLMILTEYMEDGSMLDMLRGPIGERLELAHFLYLAAQVASGMAYLEGKEMIHRDLAARNVLMGPSLLCKVCDFGLARNCVDIYNPRSDGKFPVRWTALEALIKNSFSIKSDVWSFGVLVMEIITGGAIPYPGLNNVEVVEYISSNQRIRRPEKCPVDLYDKILDCWNVQSELRPTFDFLKDYMYNYDAVSGTQYYA